MIDFKDNFWREASMRIENLLHNPIKLQNEDLLIEYPEDPPVASKMMKSIEKYKSKFSSFNSKYTNYKPQVMNILKNSEKISVYHRMRSQKTPSPRLIFKNKLPYQDDLLKISNSHFLEIYGQRSTHPCLPKLANPENILKFLIRIHEKYSLLYKCLKEEDENIRIGSLMDYLFKQGGLKKNLPRYKTPTPEGHQSLNSVKRRRNLYNDVEYSKYIQEQAQSIIVIYM